MRVPEHFEPRLSSLRSAGVLKSIRPESLPQHLVKTVGELTTVNLMVLSCCDGHQFANITSHTFACCEQAKTFLGLGGVADDCFHWKTENGGPFVLSVPQLQVRYYRGAPDNVRRNTLASMEESRRMKQLDVVLLIGHCLCGKVKDIFKDPEEYVEYMARAKETIMADFGLPGERVISWLQTFRKQGRRIYHVNFGEAVQLRKAA